MDEDENDDGEADMFGSDDMPALEGDDEEENAAVERDEEARPVVERRYTEEEIFGDDGFSSDGEAEAEGSDEEELEHEAPMPLVRVCEYRSLAVCWHCAFERC